MKKYFFSKLTSRERADLIKRPAQQTKSLTDQVRKILSEVKARGDEALKSFTKAFDKVDIQKFRISEKEIARSAIQIDPSLMEAFRTAAQNIRTFHEAQKRTEDRIETMPGVTCWREQRPIQKVGLYVPGGTANLPSTVLMLAIPAQVAGCEDIVLCTPPRKDGTVAPEILAAASISGVTQVFSVGGAQAIAAMGYGTETIPRVDKIFGPGNQYVTAAKMILVSDAEGVSIDMPAGPSEVLVIADEQANPAFVASDLLSQAEHGTDSQVVLISPNESLMVMVEQEVEAQLRELPRKDIAQQALENSLLLVSEDLTQALTFSNEYAPEHLILNVQNPNQYLPLITSAGSVFIGPYAPESVGDYASGTNHTLPTAGYARNTSGVSVDSFVKRITFQELTAEGLRNIGPVVEKMAEAEQLQAHKNAVTLRLQNI